jgi:Reverse transcriptase (RNA-dependent DNA polymerase)
MGWRRTKGDRILSTISTIVTPTNTSREERAHGKDPDQNEVRQCVFQSSPEKVPRSDGLMAQFIQEKWEIMGLDIVKIIWQAFTTYTAPIEWMTYHVILFTKNTEPKTPKDYRPISIDNILYRLLAKITTNRFQHYMNSIISKTQSDFIKGRSITDNTILMKEVLHSFSSTNYNEQDFALKVDIVILNIFFNLSICKTILNFIICLV